jgi:PBP1b-binding outer membrane lipoprotein LpoB
MRSNIFYISILIVLAMLFSCCAQPDSKNDAVPETSVHTSETPQSTVQNIELQHNYPEMVL